MVYTKIQITDNFFSRLLLNIERLKLIVDEVIFSFITIICLMRCNYNSIKLFTTVKQFYARKNKFDEYDQGHTGILYQNAKKIQFYMEVIGALSVQSKLVACGEVPVHK